jgi:hypothetical protein
MSRICGACHAAAGGRQYRRDVPAGPQGKAVLASENFAMLRGFKLGDVVDIPSPSGMLHLPIAGIVTDYSDEQGSLLVDRALYKRYWNDSTVNVFRIYLARGAVEADVKRRILETIRQSAAAFVLTNREVRRYILRLTDQWFGITYVQIAVAVLVAVLGIVNTSDGFHHRSAARAWACCKPWAGCAIRSVAPSGWRRWRWEPWD